MADAITGGIRIQHPRGPEIKRIRGVRCYFLRRDTRRKPRTTSRNKAGLPAGALPQAMLYGSGSNCSSCSQGVSTTCPVAVFLKRTCSPWAFAVHSELSLFDCSAAISILHVCK